mmetsp:Transcript_52450/g.119437  ORF Transcript_52450/g.119437 Transcript_52450/m.119437 type:complete len:298 (-) Transcript_52450:2-895(-)
MPADVGYLCFQGLLLQSCPQAPTQIHRDLVLHTGYRRPPTGLTGVAEDAEEEVYPLLYAAPAADHFLDHGLELAEGVSEESTDEIILGNLPVAAAGLIKQHTQHSAALHLHVEHLQQHPELRVADHPVPRGIHHCKRILHRAKSADAPNPHGPPDTADRFWGHHLDVVLGEEVEDGGVGGEAKGLGHSQFYVAPIHHRRPSHMLKTEQDLVLEILPLPQRGSQVGLGLVPPRRRPRPPRGAGGVPADALLAPHCRRRSRAVLRLLGGKMSSDAARRPPDVRRRGPFAPRLQRPRPRA